MRVISGATRSLSEDLISEISRYRYKVFVKRLGWDLHSIDGMEKDQFDRTDTIYVVAKDDEGNVYGCARLLPTTHSYLLGEVFPQLLNGLQPPSSPDVWELSRFAAVDFKNKKPSSINQFSSPIAIELLRESLICAAQQGAKRVVTVSPLGIDRLLRIAGFKVQRAGPPMIINGHRIFACWIEINQ